jgi:transposase InsO family protein
MAHGFMYLVAIMDWYSRYVLAWRLSNTLDADFCVEALEEALRKGKPDVFNEKTRTPCGLCRRDELSEAMYIV